jgi:hypothetical protein
MAAKMDDIQSTTTNERRRNEVEKEFTRREIVIKYKYVTAQ